MPIIRELGKILAPALRELGLIPSHEFLLQDSNCSYEEGCNCRIHRPFPEDFGTWMVQDAPNAGHVGLWIYDSHVAAVDLKRRRVYDIDASDPKLLEKIKEHVS